MACCSDRRDTDRAMIIDFIHYEPTAVDAAAQRLASSADCYERALGQIGGQAHAHFPASPEQRDFGHFSPPR